MSTIYIHPGMHKTGTSSIQGSLAALPEGRGPKLLLINGNTNMSTQARLAFSVPETYARRKKVDTDEVERRGPEFRATLARMLEESAGGDAVISAEGLNVLVEQEFRELIGLVKHDAISIVVYVREPAGAAASRLQQQVKAGVVVPSPARFVPDYRKNLAKYVRLQRELPNLSYQFVPYDREQLHEGCVVRDFSRRIGVTIAADEVRNSNESLTREATRLLYCRNLYLEQAGLPRRTASDFADVLNTVGGPKFRLSRELIEKGMKRYANSIAWMGQHLASDWLTRLRDDDGSEIRGHAQLSRVPKEARAWLRERVAGYHGSPEPLVIGAAMERLVAALWADLDAAREAEQAEAIAQRKVERLAEAVAQRKAEKAAAAAQRKVERLAEAVAQRKAEKAAAAAQRKAARLEEAEQRKAERLAEAAQRRAEGQPGGPKLARTAG